MRKTGKKITAILASFALIVGSLTACGTSGEQKTGEETTTKDGVTIVRVGQRNDYVEIWEAVNKILEPENIKVEATTFDSSVSINDLLGAGDLDLNVAQHYAAVDYFNSVQDSYTLVALSDIAAETYDMYSKKYDSVEELPDGATISIANDVMNAGRAFFYLEKAGLIELDDNWTTFPEESNIVRNPKNFQFTDVETTACARILDDVDAGFVYSINAVDAGLNPDTDPILANKIDFSNEFEKQFTLVFTGIQGDETNETFKKVIDAYHSEEVFKIYKQLFNGGTFPVVDGKEIDLSQY